MSEIELQTECLRILNGFKRLGQLTFWRIPISPVRTTGGVRKNPMSGWSDLFVMFKYPHCLWVELKAKNGKLGKSQRLFKKELNEFGHPYVVVKSTEEFYAALAPYLEELSLSQLRRLKVQLTQ